MSSKVYPDAASALRGVVKEGMTLMCGGFGACGIPENLIDALHASGIGDLTVVSNNAGLDGVGLGLLLQTRQIRKMISSYVGENKEFERQYLAGELELEFNPQGTLAERIRAGGAGIYGFYTKVGAGTLVAEGKETRTVDGETYVLEKGLVADVSLVKAWKGDTEGNLDLPQDRAQFQSQHGDRRPRHRRGGRGTGAPSARSIRTIFIRPGIFVQRIIQGARYTKLIEKRTVRKREGKPNAVVA